MLTQLQRRQWPCGHQSRQQFALLGRTRQGARGQRGLAVGGGAEPQLAGPRRFALAQQPWQRRGQHRAQRVVVIARRPGQQVQQRLVQQRLFVEYRGDRPQLVGGQVCLCGQGDHQPDQRLPAEGHAHAATHCHGLSVRQIIEQPAQRRVQRDTDDGLERHRLVMFVHTSCG